MTSGILIFAHNSTAIPYILLATLAGSLAKKYLNVGVTLVTDHNSVEYIKDSKYHEIFLKTFENITIVDTPITSNTRNLQDGPESEIVPFINSNRANAWDLTPYDRTLLIDCDFLIFSNHLSNYWNNEDLLINSAIKDISIENRLSYSETYVSDTSIRLLWATNVMFTKDKKSKIFFELVQHIKDNYMIYRDIYGFDSIQYRNDVSFSIAHHILSGYFSSGLNLLPPIFTAIDKDILQTVKSDGNLIFLISQNSKEYAVTSMKNIDIHVMNKKSILRNIDVLLGLAQ